MAVDERDGGDSGPLRTSGVQGWLFERPPQDAQCESMKPPRRLGKGLADMVGLHGGTIVTSADDDDGSDQHDDAATDESAPGPVLHLLSTEAAGLPGPRVVKPSAEGLAEAETGLEPVSEPPPVFVHEPAPVAVEPARVDVAPVAPVVPEPAAAPASPPEPEPEVVSEGFTDDWFDPPIATYSPASGFRRVEPAAAEAPEPEPVPQPPVQAAPPPPPEPEPVRQPEPEPVAVLDDPVVVDDGLFFDDVVVGSFLPEIDLDS